MPFHHCASKKLRSTVLVELAVQSHRHNRLLAAMPPNTLALLEPDLRQVSLEQGAVLLEPGELIENIYFPLTGLISLMVIGKNGNFVETSTVGREGAVGLHSGLGRRRSFTRATAQIGGKFSTVRAARFEHVANGNSPIRDVAVYRSALGPDPANRGLQRHARRLRAFMSVAVADR
jgi:hypothetical protein